MKIFRFAFYFFSCFPAFLNICLASTENFLSTQQIHKNDAISHLLQATEEIGTTNPQQFDRNLIQLKNLQNKFTDFQKDYFDFLVFYQQGYNGDFQKSLNNFLDLFAISEFIEIKFRAQSKIANIHIISGNFTQAINSLDYVLNHINSISKNFLKQEGYKVASTIYFLIGENELSLNFSNLMLKNNPSKNDYCKAVTNIGRIKLRQIEEISSDQIKYTNKAISACEVIGDFVFSNLLKLDWLKFKLNSPLSDSSVFQSVLGELTASEKEIERTKYKNLINIKNSLLAKTYWKLSNFDKAITYAMRTLKGSESIGSTLQKIEVLQILIDYYQKIKNDKLAFKFLAEKNHAEKKNFDQVQAKTMAYQTAKHNSLAKTHEIAFLNQKNKLLSLEKNLTDKTAINQKLLILFLIAVTVFILMWGFRNKKNQKLYKILSERDDLTLIYNRKGLKDHMEQLLSLSGENGQPVAYAIFDLDNFKNINDEFGHITGDWVIKTVIRQCQLLANENITLGRIGGEEFAIAMKNSTCEELLKFTELCRKKIHNINTEKTGYDFKISASFGVTSTTTSGYKYTLLMTHADKAMYIAKVAGRNMVVNYNDNI